MLRPSALKAASRGEEIGRGIGYSSPGSVQPIPSRWVTGRKLAARVVYIIFFQSLVTPGALRRISDSSGVSLSSAHLCKHDLCCWGVCLARTFRWGRGSRWPQQGTQSWTCTVSRELCRCCAGLGRALLAWQTFSSHGLVQSTLSGGSEAVKGHSCWLHGLVSTESRAAL